MEEKTIIKGLIVLVLIMLFVITAGYRHSIKACEIQTIDDGEVRYLDSTTEEFYINTSTCGNCVDFKVEAKRSSDYFNLGNKTWEIKRAYSKSGVV